MFFVLFVFLFVTEHLSVHGSPGMDLLPRVALAQEEPRNGVREDDVI